MFAHSIKNPQTIHYKRKYHKGEYHTFDEATHRYLCCHCFTPSKATDKAEEVTCQNCIHELGKTLHDRCVRCGNIYMHCACPDVFTSIDTDLMDTQPEFMRCPKCERRSPYTQCPDCGTKIRDPRIDRLTRLVPTRRGV